MQGTVRRTSATLIVIATAFGLLAATSAVASPTASRAFGAATLKLGATGSAVRTLQQGLTTLGFPAQADGQFGRGTRKRLKQWEKTNAATQAVVRNGKLSSAEAKLFAAQVRAKKVAGASAPDDAATPQAQPLADTTAGQFTALGLERPLPRSTMTSKFWEPRSYERHPGVDLAIASGTPIHAAGDGRVTQAGEAGGYGNFTCIAHTSVVSTCYAHQSAILVREGATVAKDQVIGLVGCTGHCTGPHLHFELRVSGDVRCPAPWLGVASSDWCWDDAPGYGSTDARSARAAGAGVARIRPPRGDAAD